MARDELDLSDLQPSRIARVVVVASTLAVILIAAWVFAPILLAKYGSATATAATGPQARPAGGGVCAPPGGGAPRPSQRYRLGSRPDHNRACIERRRQCASAR